MKFLMSAWADGLEDSTPIVATLEFNEACMEQAERLCKTVRDNNLFEATSAEPELKATFYYRREPYPAMMTIQADGRIEWVHRDISGFTLSASEDLELLRKHFRKAQENPTQGVYINCDETIETWMDDLKDWTEALVPELRSLVHADFLAKRALEAVGDHDHIQACSPAQKRNL